jgi:hypothetical protein
MFMLALVGFVALSVVQDLTVIVQDAESSRKIRSATVLGNGRGALTNRQGVVMFRDVADTVVLRTSMLGYTQRIDTHVVRSPSDTIAIALSPRLFDAPSITVTASRAEQARADAPMIVTVTDRESGETVRQIPPEAAVRISRNIDQLTGIFVDQKA